MFAYLKKLDVRERTSWIELPWITPGARLKLRPAGEANPGYFNAMLARAARRLAALQARGGADALRVEDVAQNRAEDVALFPDHVVVGWEGILDDQGRTVDFSRENCAALLAALPEWIVDKIRNHAGSPERFLAPGEEAPPDAAPLDGR